MKNIILSIAAIIAISSLASCGTNKVNRQVIDRYSNAGEYMGRDTVSTSMSACMKIGDTARFNPAKLGDHCGVVVKVANL